MNDSVSRETPPVPASARGVFAARSEIASAYAELLATDGLTRGLIGPREVPRLWERHLLNCAVLTELLPDGADVCDIGSGAGLPGLVLAIRRPDLRVTLVEPLLRRVNFLTETVERLGLGNVQVLRARADELHGESEFSVVTARAVAPLPRLLQWSMPLVSAGGALIAVKGASARDEVREAEPELRRWDARSVEVLSVGAQVIDPPTTVIRVVASRASRLGWDSGAAKRVAKAGSGRGRRGRGRRT